MVSYRQEQEEYTHNIIHIHRLTCGNECNHGNTGLDIANHKSHAHFIIYSLHSALVSNTGTGNGTVDTQ